MKNTKKRKDYLFIFGVIIIFLGFLVCLSIWFWFFGIIIFFLGAIIVLFSKEGWEKKLLVIVVPLIIYYPLLYTIINIFNEHAPPSTFLIPENFRGKAVIYYGEPCGEKLAKENGRNIYNITETGVIVVQDSIDKGILDYEYYFIDKYGNRTKIEIGIPGIAKKESDKNGNRDPKVFIGPSGGGRVKDDKAYKSSLFYIMSSDSFKNYRSDSYDTSAYKILKDCREKLLWNK